MELGHFQYFVAVAEERHYGRAAERLHIAQPAPSQQIKRFETLVGAPLIERTTRQVSLTPKGEAPLPEARLTLGHAERAAQAAQHAVQYATLVGLVAADIGISVLPDPLRRLQLPMVRYVRIKIRDASTRVSLAFRTTPEPSVLMQQAIDSVSAEFR